MIEINLVPDVKLELIRAQRQRNMVISISILATVVAVAVTTLLAAYVFGAQTLRGKLSDDAITKQSTQLQSVSDLAKALTVQHQIPEITATYNATNMDSRVFDIIKKVVPASSSNATISTFNVDAATQTITLEGETSGGYGALDALKKTIIATKFEYTTADEQNQQSVPLTTSVSDGDRSLGQDQSGRSTLRFSIKFVYNSAVFSRTSLNGAVRVPGVTNATDSATEIPSSIFTDTKQGTQ